MRTILLSLVFICCHSFAYENQDFEDKYNVLAEKMVDLGTWSLIFKTEDKAKSTNLICLSTLDAINFLNHIIDYYSDYKEMLEKIGMTALPKNEFEKMKINRLTEIEGDKKALTGTKYNCTHD